MDLFSALLFLALGDGMCTEEFLHSPRSVCVYVWDSLCAFRELMAKKNSSRRAMLTYKNLSYYTFSRQQQ